MAEEKREKSCGAVVYCMQGEEVRYLMIRQHGHEFWGCPKGHVEGEETEHETAVREIREEVGLDVTFVDGFRNEIFYLLPPACTVVKQVVYFLAQFDPSQPITVQPSEIAEYRLATLGEAIALARSSFAEILKSADKHVPRPTVGQKTVDLDDEDFFD